MSKTTMPVQSCLRRKILATAILLPLGVTGTAIAGETTRVSVDSTGAEVNGGNSVDASISANGRFTVFGSNATNLVAGDTNGSRDVFVRDRKLGTTTRVSVDSAGVQASGGVSDEASISADGRFVAFYSAASNLVSGDTNGIFDVFVHDRKTGATTRVSVDSTGAQASGGDSFAPSISANGRFVAFTSYATNLVTGDTNVASDIFVHDRKKGKTTRVSVDSAGDQTNPAPSAFSSISANGRFVAFASQANDLVSGDTNDRDDVFVHDRKTRKTKRVSVQSDGAQANGNSFGIVSISADGRFVAFDSEATNLVPEDTNGLRDVFVHDRKSGKITRVSVDSSGAAAIGGDSAWASISKNGRFVAFDSGATNLVDGDTNALRDVFVHDRKTGSTSRISVHPDGAETTGGVSGGPSISANGRFVCFESDATNLVTGDTNAQRDVFLHDRK